MKQIKIYREFGGKAIAYEQQLKNEKNRSRKHYKGQGFFHLLDDWSKDWKNNDPEIQNEDTVSMERDEHKKKNINIDAIQ